MPNCNHCGVYYSPNDLVLHYQRGCDQNWPRYGRSVADLSNLAGELGQAAGIEGAERRLKAQGEALEKAHAAIVDVLDLIDDVGSENAMLEVVSVERLDRTYEALTAALAKLREAAK